ncbi:hypothetical protein ANN_26568 [Periplaneta americana]|uniref:Uncharacterized protein n=1 Tax=Periplaneta americana TaxID=6978 RepID=A0ABQ8RYP6_PERAM|nr:hypothetical protein ANN_26568 [Periplaneta americana]
MAGLCEGSNESAGSLKAICNTESYPAFAHIGLRENPGKNLNQVTCPDRESNPGHLVSQPDALTVTPQRSKTFSKEEARMLGNAIQHYWKLVVERLHHIVPWLGGRMHFAAGGKMFIKNVELEDRNRQIRVHVILTLLPKMELPLRRVRLRPRQAIIAAVEQSVRRLVQQDTVEGIRRLPEVWRRVLHVGGDYF